MIHSTVWNNMLIGVPKEIKVHEYRVGLTPESAAELVRAGHEVFLETKAGEGIGAPDKVYEKVGVKILADADAVFAESEMIVKVKEPLPEEYPLLRAGQIRYWGVSNFRGWRIAELVRLAGQLGMPGPVVCQPYYNLLNRLPEFEVLPACEHYGIGVAPYSPIARGVLTGKYLPGHTPDADSRAGRADPRMAETEFRAESLLIAQQLQVHAQARGVSLAQFACAWVLANRVVSSLIAGPRTLAQWQHYAPALDYVFTKEDEALVDSLVRPGHPSTPGYTDPSYPPEGRKVSHDGV